MLTTHIAILNATEGDDLLAARSLFQQYRRLFGGEDLEKEGIAQEIAGLPWVYQQPYGDLLVARVAGIAAGCVALRTRAHHEGELKRMFVLPDFRGLGVGRALATAILNRAWQLGMDRVCLDTLPSMVGAQSLYTSIGFKSRIAYNAKSEDDTLFFEMERPQLSRLRRGEPTPRHMRRIHLFSEKYALVLRSLRNHVQNGALTTEDK
jgi:GNAT superfamily N-acetyltransferase